MFDALGLNGKDINYISEQTGRLIRKTYFDNDYGSIKIANSMWLREDAELKKDYTDNAEKNFYSPVFGVNFGNMETSERMKKWVEDNTNNLISPKFEVSPAIFMYIINTLYFKDTWTEFFLENANTNEIFRGLNNQNIACEFMNKKIHGSLYYNGDGFTASSLRFMNGGKMMFILPDEGIDIYDLVASPEKLNYALDANNADIMDVTYKVPKFESKANFDLIGILEDIGINQAFVETADFSGMTDTSIYISEVRQETYIKVDEIGVEATAMTAIAMTESGPLLHEETDFFLDRPFIYFITDKNGVILFKGIILNPNE